MSAPAQDENAPLQAEHVSVLSTTLGQSINLVPLEPLVTESGDGLFADLRLAVQHARSAGVVDVNGGGWHVELVSSLESCFNAAKPGDRAAAPSVGVSGPGVVGSPPAASAKARISL